MSSSSTDPILSENMTTDTGDNTNSQEPSTSSSQQYRSSTQYAFKPAPENSKTSTKPNLEDEDSDEKRNDSMYVCNICLDVAKDSVVTMCGHLYCWPCLNCWIETRPTRQLCPVCKAAISKEKVVPLYGRNSEKQQDPRSKIPPRPAGQRTEPENSQNYQGFQSFGENGFHLSFGIGAFPFGFFASSFNFNDFRPRNGQQPGSPQYEEDQFLSKVFLWVAMIFFFWLILA